VTPGVFDGFSFSQVALPVGPSGPTSSMMKTYSPKPDHIERRWYVLDASGQVLGRLAAEVATLLRGKHKPIYAPHMDTGDHVIVINADKVELTGDKRETKIAYRHSGFPGGLTEISYGRLLDERADRAVEKAVRGMLPKNRLGRQMIKKLHVERGPEHRHQAQRPVSLGVGERPVWTGFPAPAPTPADATASAARDSARSTTSDGGATPAPSPSPATTSAAKKPTARASTSAKKPAAAKTPAAGKKPAAKKPAAAAQPTKKRAPSKPATGEE
jgi:large subunit ribosomal protein L13